MVETLTNPELAAYVRRVLQVLDPQYYFEEREKLELVAQRLEGPEMCASSPASPHTSTEIAEALKEAIRLINVAFGEYACAARKHLSEEDRKKFETNFASPARDLINRASAALKAAENGGRTDA